MAVPEDIRMVRRPVNTIVDDSGRDSPYRYSVRERAGAKCVPGENPKPRNGKVIGHIINGQYVPIQENIIFSEPDMLSYGASAAVKSVSTDILFELLDVYPAKEAFTIMSIATLKAIKPSITVNHMQTHYYKTFVCKDYPGVTLSPNSVTSLLQKLGQDGAKRRLFYQKRTDAVSADHHIAIDGTLKQDTSEVNDLSAFSYKAKHRGHRDISILYAYDIESMEPICAEVFPGNNIDASSYSAFIRDNDIKKGIIIANKGFPPSAIKAELKDRLELHFLTPIKRNDVRIGSNNMLNFEGALIGLGAHVLYKKANIKDGRFLYAFKNSRRAAAEETAYLASAEKHKNFDQEKYIKCKDLFGVIVFESDHDMPPETAYLCYDDRRLLELVFKRYKNDECLDKTNVQGDFSVIGSEFINFITTLVTCRVIRKARIAGLLKKMTYGELIDDLSSAWRKVDAPTPPISDDSYWVHTYSSGFGVLEALGLSTPTIEHEPKKRGRPRINPVPIPKRPRGRPKKNTVPNQL